MKALLLAVAVVLGPCAVAQTTFTTIGNITFGSDGSTATTIGGTTFVTGASPVIYQSLGSTAPAKNAAVSSTVQKIGNITFITDSDGSTSTLQTIGNITFINDGSKTSTVQKIGNIYFLNEGE
jgi:3-deoxy-D-arabino-heptulosonate 7-phosphate (DAHP) synthase